MKRKYFVGLAGALCVLALLAGCAAKSSSSSTASSITVQPDEVALNQQLEELAGGEYAPLKEFVDASLAKATPAQAGEMVQALILASERQLTSAAEYIYGDNRAEIQAAILAALPEAPTETENLSTLCASDKEALLDKMPEGEIKTQLSAWMEMGLCLHNAEGTYFFVLDYPEYLAEYGQTVDGATADFLTLAADEVKAPTLVEEYLSVDVETLGQRALAYETFLSQYPDFSLADKVRIYWNGALSKLVYPTLYDQLVDEAGQASADLMALYQELAGQTACPVLQSTAQSMLDFIAAQSDQSLADSDQVSQNASALAEEARQMADELYGPLPQ